MHFFWVVPGFLGTFVGYFADFWVSFFLVKFDFFKSNPDFLGIDFDILLMTLWNVACRALVSYFLQSDLTYGNNNISSKTGWTVYTENIKPEVLTYRPTAGRSIRRTKGFIFFV